MVRGCLVDAPKGNAQGPLAGPQPACLPDELSALEDWLTQFRHDGVEPLPGFQSQLHGVMLAALAHLGKGVFVSVCSPHQD